MRPDPVIKESAVVAPSNSSSAAGTMHKSDPQMTDSMEESKKEEKGHQTMRRALGLVGRRKKEEKQKERSASVSSKFEQSPLSVAIIRC